MKKVFSVIIMVICMISFCGSALAGGFRPIAASGRLHLGEDQAWEREYKTKDGKIKIRFRNLRLAVSKKKYHLIIWWNGKRILDGYSPKSRYDYSFKVFRDDSTDRIFIAMETAPRVVLYGYDPNAGKLHKYVDSNNYYSPVGGPVLTVDRDSDLRLSFLGRGKGAPTSYKLFWDEKKSWFGYEDVTVRTQYDEEEDDDEQYEAPVYENEELFYIEDEVVGS